MRAWQQADGPIFRKWEHQDTDIARTLFNIPFPPPPYEAPTSPAAAPSPDDENFPFTIETVDGAVAGALHTHHSSLRNGTFMYGIAIFPEHQRKGYAHEAIWLTLRYYFDERRYQKCTTEVYSFNEASIRLHERLGFTQEGRLRRMVYTDGAFHDTLFYGMTCEEFRTKRQQTLSD